MGFMEWENGLLTQRYGPLNWTLKVAVFWDLTLCSLVDKNMCFINACSLHLQDIYPDWYLPTKKLHGVTSQNRVTFAVIVNGIVNRTDGTFAANFCKTGKCTENLFNVMCSIYS
jgi:hypothetical protein